MRSSPKVASILGTVSLEDSVTSWKTATSAPASERSLECDCDDNLFLEEENSLTFSDAADADAACEQRLDGGAECKRSERRKTKLFFALFVTIGTNEGCLNGGNAEVDGFDDCGFTFF